MSGAPKLSLFSGAALALGCCALVFLSASRWYPWVELFEARARLHADSRRIRAAPPAPATSETTPALKVRILERIEITSSRRYCWFPTLHRFSDGALFVTVRTSPDEASPTDEFSAFVVSQDGGHRWSRRFPLGAGGNPDAAYSQAASDELIVAGSGYDAVEADPPGQRKRFRFVLSRFSRSGMQLEQRRDAVLELSEPAADEKQFAEGETSRPAGTVRLPQVQPYGGIIPGGNGDWLMTLYYRITPDPRYSRLVLMRSSDRGLTWRESSVIAGVAAEENAWSWIGSEGPTEAALVSLPDSRLYVLYRTGGFMGEAWSSDDGRSWTAPKPTTLRGVAPHIRKLASGVLACTFGRPGPVSIRFNLDGTGKSWSQETPIFSGMSTAYSDLLEIAPGKLLVVYDSVPYGWQQIPVADRQSCNRILGTFVQVER